MNIAETFFYKHSAYSWHPKRETPEQGRAHCAIALAEAESWASREGYFCRWLRDVEGSHVDPHGNPDQWACLLYTPDGVIIDSLHGIDFQSGQPWGETYRRVVEAQLALDAMSEET